MWLEGAVMSSLALCFRVQQRERTVEGTRSVVRVAAERR